METISSLELRRAIRSKYAWPGGYPMFGITADGGCLCMECMRKEYVYIAQARRANDRWCGWMVVAVDINYEDTDLLCDHCGEQIE